MNPVYISAAVEGPVDEAVLRRLAQEAGVEVDAVHGKHGKRPLREQIGAYNRAAQFNPWIVLVDLDQDAGCAPSLRREWLTDPAPLLSFRIAVREVEAWLLADRERVASYLGIPESRVPLRPDEVPDPKRAFIDLARRSRRRAIRDDLVPTPGGGREVGPGYTARVIEFILDTSSGWRPEAAARSSESLARCVADLRRLAEMSPRPGG